MTPALKRPDPSYSTDEEILAFNALTQGDRETLETLVRKGVDVAGLDLEGVSVLHVAIESGHSELVPYLLSLGADVNADDEESNTPHLIAAAKGQFDAMKQLVEHGAAIEGANVEGLTSLHFAASLLDTAMIAWLFEQGANVNAQAKDGRSAVELCLRSFPKETLVTRTYDTLRLLCSHGAKWNASDNERFKIGIDIGDSEFRPFPKWRKGLFACLELWEVQHSANEAPLMEIPEEVVKEGNKAVSSYIEENRKE